MHSAPAPKITPMLQQYLEMKAQYPDTVLFYRIGDFYEMFLDDAELGSRVMGIALTTRSRDNEAKVPMCGVPYHALSGYLAKMIRAGYRVALCEQVEDPKAAKGIVRREVVRVISPGVTTEDQLLDEKRECFLCALVLGPAKARNRLAGLAFLDVSTGRFLASEVDIAAGHDALLDVLVRMQPAELLQPQEQGEAESSLTEAIRARLAALCLTFRPAALFERACAQATLQEHFHTVNMAGFGCAQFTLALQAAGALLAYVQETQKTGLGHIDRLSPLQPGDFLIIDESSRRNLELTETIVGGRREGSLLDTLDMSATPMGARLFRNWLLFPLKAADAIKARLAAVEELAQRSKLRARLRELLSHITDMERLCSRLTLNQGNARDLNALGLSLARLPEFQAMLADASAPLLSEIFSAFDPLADVHGLIASAIRDDAPPALKEGGMIREGFDAELDRLMRLLRDGKKLILELEGREREKSGLSKLKVGYNRVFGYYFELSRTQSGQVPDYFIRKQTLANVERYITPELKELEEAITNAQEKRLDLEFALFSRVRGQIASESRRLLAMSAHLATVDVLAALAEAAVRFRYCRPEINEGRSISIKEGRHPVIERNLEPGRFVPNDLHLDHEGSLLHIITGPNMAGKSTVLRQTALIVLMAHLGSFVPADSASICLVDRIFTRVGAMDNLRSGQSTFMVEMNETANILHNATENSLVILDEIGRGTSTYDGLAIAWAVAEELAGKNGLGIKTLFATHYHELVDLAATCPGVRNFSVAVREWNESIIFLHKLVEGGASRSYGIQVASLAGVPAPVIRRASAILKKIERHGQPGDAGSRADPAPRQMSLFPRQESPLDEFLRTLDPDAMTPREALDTLYRIRELVKEAK